MTIPSVTTSIPASVGAPKGGAPAAQTAAAAVSDSSSTTTVSTPAQTPAALLDALLAAVKQSAAARQDGLAVLMANALQAAAATTLPDPVQTAVDQLLALHLPTDQAPDATAIKTALQTSGLFTEANLASATTRMPIDVKTALLQLNQAAEAWLARAVIASDPKLDQTSQLATAAASQSGGRIAAPVPGNTTLANNPSTASKAQGVSNAIPSAQPGVQTPMPEMSPPVPAQPSMPGATTQKTIPAVSAQQAPRPTAPVPAITPESASAIHTPIPGAFKPVLQLLTQAVEVLETQPEAALKAPVAPSPQIATPTKQIPASATVAPARPPASAPIKAAMALLSQAIENWPASPPEPPPSLPEPIALTVATKIAAQTFAAAQQAPTAKQPDTTVPPEIKAILALLGKAVQPWLEPAADNTSVSATGPTTKLPVTVPNNTTVSNTGSDAAKTASAAASRYTPPSGTPGKLPAPTELPDPAVTTPTKSPSTSSDTAAPSKASPLTPGQTSTVSATSSPPPPSQTPAPATPNDVRALLSLLSKAVENWQEPTTASADVRPAQPSVPPPAPGAPGKAQGPTAPTLPEKADIALIAKTLAVGSDAALARQTLLQIASLPDASQTRTNQARWMFDLPVMTAQGPAVAQIAIERDGRNATPDQPKPVWRVQFAIDIAPLGPVRASMALSGGQTWITIQAEKDDAVEKLRSQVSWLASALQETELEANIAVEPGRTTRPARRGTPLVDRAS